MKPFISSTLVLLLCLVALPLVFAEEAKPEENAMPKLEDAKTIADVKAYIEALRSQQQKIMTELQTGNFSNRENVKEFFDNLTANYLKSSEKLLDLTKDAKKSEDYELGCQLKLEGLMRLFSNDFNGKINASLKGAEVPSPEISDSEKNLLDFLDEVEKDGLCVKEIPRFRVQLFIFTLRTTIAQNKGNFLTVADYADLFEKAKEICTKYQSVGAIQNLLAFCDSEEIRKEKPDFPEDFTADVIAYYNSPECTIPESEKNKQIEQIQGMRRRFAGAELNLYGRTIDDKDFDWQSYRGQYVLVKFTASWCGPCKAEIPGMIEAYTKYKDKGFDIISVAIWCKAEEMKHTIEEEKIPWTVISSELTEAAKLGESQGKFYGIAGVPTMLLIDKEGKIIHTAMRGPLLQKTLAELFPE